MELNEFYKLFLPSINLWKAYNHTPYSEHYFKFVELVVLSTIKLFESMGLTDLAIKSVTEMIKQNGLENKIEQLLKNYNS